jgi:plastocyanin
MDQLREHFKKGKNLTNLIVLLVMVLALPIGIGLVRNQQILRSQADEDPVQFLIGGCVEQRGDQLVATCPDVSVQLVSPLGPPATSTSSASLVNKSVLAGFIKNTYAQDGGNNPGGSNKQPGNFCTAASECASNICTKSVCWAPGDAGTNQIQGKVFSDANNNKQFDSGEAGISGVKVNIIDAADGSGVTGATTDSEGVYTVSQDSSPRLYSRGYKVEVVTPSGATLTTPNSVAVTLSNNTQTVNFGILTAASPTPSPTSSASSSPSSSPATGDVTLTVDKTEVDVGDKIKVSWSGIPSPKAKDWLGAFEVNEGNGKADSMDWVYVNCDPNKVSTTAKAAGGCLIEMKEAGDFEFRLFANDQENLLATSESVRVHAGSNDDDDDDDREGKTVSFRYAETPLALSSAEYKPYDKEPKIFEHKFSDPKPGIKTIFVEFKDTTGKTTRPPLSASILLIPPDITIDSASCSLSNFGSGINIELKGKNFGDKPGKIRLPEWEIPDGKVTDWKDGSISTTIDFPEGFVFSENVVEFEVERFDKGTLKGTCAIGNVSTLALGTRLFCRAPNQQSETNIQVEILEDSKNAPVKREAASLTKAGLIQGLELEFVKGKRYLVSVDAPKSLRRGSKPFIATSGTTQLLFKRNDGSDINRNTLPVGDIFPLGDGDGIINTLDANQLYREWGQFSEEEEESDRVIRNGDFNQDGKVNSIDWACMRFDFNQSDDPTLAPTEFELADQATNINEGNPTAQPTPRNLNSGSSNSSGNAGNSTDGTELKGFVEIKGNQYTPGNLTVKKGTLVTWTNKDAERHTVTMDTASDSDNHPILVAGDTYSTLFSEPGTYSYHCDFHPTMKGTITVTE